MLVVTRESDLHCKFPPHQRALVALAYLRKHDTLAQVAACFGISLGTTHAYTSRVIGLLVTRPPACSQSCARAIRTTCRSTAPSPSAIAWATAGSTTLPSTADTAYTCRPSPTLPQSLTRRGPIDHVLWISPTLPGRRHVPTATHVHRIIRIRERQGVPVLADHAYQGAGL
ncbi:hypothetical protein GCM10010406_49840 [Streptomyces thermolineatus]|uniref:Transposase Helix-turn-helix domain-containing protein n=1 Tax=Streptomyces thermolineatus TaxID=44033 RepID=A0ABP6A5S0_9ACTN